MGFDREGQKHNLPQVSDAAPLEWGGEDVWYGWGPRRPGGSPGLCILPAGPEEKHLLWSERAPLSSSGCLRWSWISASAQRSPGEPQDRHCSVPVQEW